MDSVLKVIELIPRNQDQDAVWHSLERSLCEHEDVADMKTLGRFQARLPHDLAKAIDPECPFRHRFLRTISLLRQIGRPKQHLCRKGSVCGRKAERFAAVLALPARYTNNLAGTNDRAGQRSYSTTQATPA